MSCAGEVTMIRVGLLVLFTVASWTPGPVAAQGATTVQRRFAIEQAVFTPGKPSRHYWDGVGRIDEDDQAVQAQVLRDRVAIEQSIQALTNALAASSPQAAAAVAVQRITTWTSQQVNAANHAPDPFARVTIDGEAVGSTEHKMNLYETSWSDRWFGPVVMQRGATVSVAFLDWDPDLGNHDEIGVCTWENLDRAEDGARVVATRCTNGVVTAALRVRHADDAPRVQVDARAVSCACRPRLEVEAVCRVLNLNAEPARVTLAATAETGALGWRAEGRADPVSVPGNSDTTVTVTGRIRNAMVGCRQARCTCSLVNAEVQAP
jgi:hypothetical protein